MIRKQRGYTQLELARKIGCSTTALSQIEGSLAQPRQETLEKLSHALSVPVAMFYILALDELDVPGDRRDLYQRLYEPIQNLAMEIVNKKKPESPEGGT